ncbi:hypothetical protein AAG570_000368 [Ranatra chinensis]|uniref:Amine oxidase domain-containing protein n=1 Tax=Ranatra chinensis TaxID=642074 RepID=A0ABD0YXJ5_9HEMI
MKLERCIVDTSAVDSTLECPKVVIVGAGMAGLSAADWLVRCGITDVTVIEATDRPGGRIQSCWLDGSVVELGAIWIEGACPANSVFNLACREGLIVKEDNKWKGEATSIYTTSQGGEISPLVNNTAYHSFKLIEDQAAELYGNANTDFGSLEDFISERVQQELKVFPENSRYDAARAMTGMTNELRTHLGADLKDVSANMYGSRSELPGGRVKVPSGMIGVLAPLIRDLPECIIKYRKPVVKIMWEAELKSENQSGSKRKEENDVITADYVIITASLGVLKKKVDELFVPSLPDDKKVAINKLGFGFVDHIFYKYKGPFWPRGEGSVRLAWSKDELTERSSDWLRSIGAWEEDVEQEGVIALRVAGKRETDCVEKMSNKKLMEEAWRLTRTFTGDPLLTHPVAAICSKWSSHPFFLGAKSYLAVGSTVADQLALGAPVPSDPCEIPALLFAGEATCPGHHATVHGARLSGIREAERIVKLTERLRGPPRDQKETLRLSA